MLVVSGWDGLSPNSVKLVNLFRLWLDKVQTIMRIWLQKYQVSREVSVELMVSVLSVDNEGGLEDLNLPFTTAQYITKIGAINLQRLRVSLDFLALLRETENRNKAPKDLDGWVCDVCCIPCDTSSEYKSCNHKDHCHGEKVVCNQQCGQIST